MCGICGYFSNEKSISGYDYYRAHDTLRHRGPDDEGFVIIDKTGFVPCIGDRTRASILAESKHINGIDHISRVMSQVRLSIIDLTDGGHQPMMDENRSYVVVFNGEIFNYLELKQELIGYGYSFNTDSDTEVVLRAYMKWGKDCFNRFNGMWAIGIYDLCQDRLILSRDRFGVKPLYYLYRNNKTLIFASEMKAILSLEKQIHLNYVAIREYIDHSVLGKDNETFFMEIKSVPMGVCLSFDNIRLEEKYSYWDYKPYLSPGTFEEKKEEFRNLFEDAVKLRMRSDVEVGSLLSGGLDSNTIVSLIYKNKWYGRSYKAFSSVYTDEKYSEKKYIEKTVERYRVDTKYVYVNSDMVLDSIKNVIYHVEMPIRSVSIVMQYLLYNEISNSSDIKVVINGQGADELFGGYTANYYNRFFELLVNGKLLRLRNEVDLFRENRKVSLGNILLETCRGFSKKYNRGNAFNDLTFTQVTTNPLQEYLMYDDRMSMTFGIENRAPFLDYRLVEFAFSLESEYKINDINNKFIVREYARSMVDSDIINRKDKMGFTTPQESWQKKEWKSILDEFYFAQQTPPYLRKEYEEYCKGMKDDWGKIWRFFCLNLWYETFKNASQDSLHMKRIG